MARESVFYSFHFDNDVFRVQQIRNMGVIEGDEPVSPNEWESVKGRGPAAIERWIDDNMKRKRCVVVLVGSETARRPWVRHEIIKAWNDNRGLVGIHIHNLKCPREGRCTKGANPFGTIKFKDGTPLSDFIDCHDPGYDAYQNIEESLEDWVDAAIRESKGRAG
jgi:hypothetical protein